MYCRSDMFRILFFTDSNYNKSRVFLPSCQSSLLLFFTFTIIISLFFSSRVVEISKGKFVCRNTSTSIFSLSNLHYPSHCVGHMYFNFLFQKVIFAYEDRGLLYINMYAHVLHILCSPNMSLSHVRSTPRGTLTARLAVH